MPQQYRSKLAYIFIKEVPGKPFPFMPEILCPIIAETIADWISKHILSAGIKSLKGDHVPLMVALHSATTPEALDAAMADIEQFIDQNFTVQPGELEFLMRNCRERFSEFVAQVLERHIYQEAIATGKTTAQAEDAVRDFFERPVEPRPEPKPIPFPKDGKRRK